jgi:WD40 repeat protein
VPRWPSVLVQVWDGEGSELLHVLRGHTLGVRPLRMFVSADGGAHVATASLDASWRLWRLHDGHQVFAQNLINLNLRLCE